MKSVQWCARFSIAAVGTTMVAAGLGIGPAGAVVPTCGSTITVNTVLTGDMTCPGDGLFINADGVTLDLNGHTVTGPGPNAPNGPNGVLAGIRILTGHTGVVIKNGRVEAFPGGIRLLSASNNEVFGVTLVNNGLGLNAFVNGPNAASPDNNHIHDNAVESSTGAGVQLVGNGQRFVNNQLVNNGNAGLVANTNNSTFTRNLIAGNGVIGGVNNGVGLQLTGNGNTVQGNSVERNASTGININGSNNVMSANAVNQNGGNATNIGGPSTTATLANNRIENNQFNANGSPTNSFGAINVFSSSGTVLTGNQVVGIRRATGIFIAGNNASATVSGNMFNQNSDGVFVGSGATSTRIIGNQSNQNTDDGIDVGSPGTFVQGNTANGNVDWGIVAINGTIDGGGNHATGNGHAGQCTANITC